MGQGRLEASPIVPSEPADKDARVFQQWVSAHPRMEKEAESWGPNPEQLHMMGNSVALDFKQT